MLIPKAKNAPLTFSPATPFPCSSWASLEAALHRSLQRAGSRIAAPAGRGLAARRRPRPVATGSAQGTGRRQGRHVAEGAPAQGLRRSVEPLRPPLRDRQVHATAAGKDERGRGVFDRAGT